LQARPALDSLQLTQNLLIGSGIICPLFEIFLAEEQKQFFEKVFVVFIKIEYFPKNSFMKS